jgi:hypothetical protein
MVPLPIAIRLLGSGEIESGGPISLEGMFMRKTILDHWVVFIVVAVTGCGSSLRSDAAGNGGAAGSGSAADGGGGANGACLYATVKREPGDSQQPWVKWPLLADGAGTLVVSASQGSTTKARTTVPNTSMKAVDASYTVDLGCPGPGTYVLRAFLDDNENSGAHDITSNDYLDSCMGGAVPEKIELAVHAGQTASAELALYQSCNPMMD